MPRSLLTGLFVFRNGRDGRAPCVAVRVVCGLFGVVEAPFGLQWCAFDMFTKLSPF